MKKLRKAIGPRRRKYNSRAVTVDGIRFHSAKEARRYGELKLMARAGLIKDLELQPAFSLVMEVKYVADFRYFDARKNSVIVEDVKGFRTGEYKRKKKLMAKQHGIEILET